jgi:hypothetical protein
MFLYLITFNCTGHLYGSTKQQQFFRKRGFTRIRVADDGERTPPVYLIFVLHKEAQRYMIEYIISILKETACCHFDFQIQIIILAH